MVTRMTQSRHSLANTLEWQFLHVASNTGHEDLADCVCGILFLGTPHKGSQAASFMDVVGGVLKPLFLNRDNGVVRSLVSNSSHLLELDGLLRFRLAKVDIYSFYELLPMKMMKKPVCTYPGQTVDMTHVQWTDNLRLLNDTQHCSISQVNLNRLVWRQIIVRCASRRIAITTFTRRSHSAS